MTFPSLPVPDYRPQFPGGDLPGIAILGCGQIARTAHLPAYLGNDLRVVGAWSQSQRSRELIAEQFPAVGRVYDRAEDLLADPDVSVVDLATRVEHRRQWLEAAIEADKHVLAQKPLTDDPAQVPALVEKAAAAGVHIAVNQNARWAPVWRLATLLLQRGAIGEVVGITHLLDKPLPPIAGTHFDDIPHMLIADYLVHWTDITRCWLGGKQVTAVDARDARVPGQPASAKNPWSATVQIECGDGATALMRVAGDARTRRPSCPFWVHGTEGTIRGSILGDDFLELEQGGTRTRFALEGAWFVDGFAGAMGELLSAIAEGREPFNSAEHNLATLQLVQAARVSAADDGAAQRLEVWL